MGIYLGLNDGTGTSHLTDEEVAKLTPAEQSFLQTDGSRSLHLLGRMGGMQNPVCTGSDNNYTVTQAPATGDDKVGALTGNHYLPSIGRAANVGLLSPHNDFRRIAETYKDNNDYYFREGRWLWGFVGTPYNFKMVNKETGETKVFAAKKTFTTDGDTKTYTGYETNPVLTAETASDDYATDWEMGDGYTDDYDTGTFTLRLLGTDKYVIMQAYNRPTLVLQTAGTTTTDFQQRSLKAYPWNYSDNKYKTVKVNIYQDVVEGEPVLTKTYTPADRAFMAGDVIDGTTGHFYLRHTDESGNAINSESKDEYGQPIPFDNNLRDLPYDLIRKFCDYTIADGTNVTTLNGRKAFTVDDTDDEQTMNVIFTVQTPESTGKRIPRFVKESELETFKSLKDNANFNGRHKQDYYYFMDMWEDLHSYMFVSKKNIDQTARVPTYTDDYIWAFGYNNNRFLVENADQLKWYFVGNPYAVRVYNAYSEVKDMNLGTNKQEANTFVFNTDRKYDDVALMHSDNNAAYSKNGKFYWEMVDAMRRNSDGNYYDLNNKYVSYRKDVVEDNAFSLRVLGDEHFTGAGSGTYHYLSINYTTKSDGTFNKYETNGSNDLKTNTMSTKHLYLLNGNTLDPRGNLLRNSMLTFPTLHHASDSIANVITAMPIARVYLTVYDHEDCTKKLTDNELSEHYAVTEQFQGVPDNLKRQFCN